jgi:putative ABC transport system substrate-binding protein
MQFGYLKRREFITLLGSAAAWPRVARGQFNPAIIGVLGSGSAQSSAFLIDALKKGMNENGLAEGRDYVLDVRWAEGDYTRFAALAFELLEHKSKVIIVTTIAAARAAQQVAPATPLVMTGLIDPVGVGLIASLARPGNNTTGISNMIQDMSAKGLELIREVASDCKDHRDVVQSKQPWKPSDPRGRPKPGCEARNDDTADRIQGISRARCNIRSRGRP